MEPSITSVIEKGRVEREFDFYNSRGITPYSKEIIERIISNPYPCVLVAPTGYGKSIAIPYAIIRAGYKVMISLPTVALCDNLYSNFAEKYPTIKLGKAYERDIDIPSGSQLIIVSNGYLKNRLLGFVKDGVCRVIDSSVADIFFLDEVHLAKLDMSIIVSLWFYCTEKFTSARFPRLLLASATPGKTVFGRKIDLCVVIPEKLFKTVYQIDDHWQKDYSVKQNDRYKDMGLLINAIHTSSNISERIIAFVPGKAEMDRVVKSSNLVNEVEFVRVMSGSSQEDFEVLRQTQDPKRVVVLSTPAGDAGLNINVDHVLDSMLIKNNVETPNGTLELQTEFISKALSKQRKGRAGRNRNGHYYPFCSMEGYDRLEDNYPSEISRLPLYKTILELNSHGLEIEDILGVYHIQRLKKDINDLLDWGLLKRSKISKELYSTAAGIFISKLEIESPRLGCILFAWHVYELPLVTGIILVNLISTITSEIFKMPIMDNDKQREEFVNTYYKRFIGRTEIHTAINIWNAVVSEVGVTSTMKDIDSWCKINYINNKIKLLIKSIHKTHNELTEEGGDIKEINIRVGYNNLIFLRRFFEFIYSDSIAVRQDVKDTPLFTVSTTSEVVKVNTTSNINQYNDPNEIPQKIVVIGKRKTASGVVVDQSLDIDDAANIQDIPQMELMEKLRIFNR